jgi:hypothetical protein
MDLRLYFNLVSIMRSSYSGNTSAFQAEARGSIPLLRWFFRLNAGWSSLVARKAHNLEVGGSNPSPAKELH